MSGPGEGPARLDPVLLDVLACPAQDHGPLIQGAPGDPAAPALTCTRCARVFPIRDGIPVLLLDEATGGDRSPA
ncbi:Trm112 family protein [Nakamurella sp.]|uniref:Trm112 family protein n=1 Tax=Nakamurella sp. TaxID=1869182 RepID=UPI003B3B39B3